MALQAIKCFKIIILSSTLTVVLRPPAMHPEDAHAIVRVFRYRWVILLLYCLYGAINFIQFMQFAIISNITKRYYNIDTLLADLNGLLFMICSIVLCLPFNYLMNKYNLRTIAIVTCTLTAAGSLIKLLSVSPSRYYVVLLGQLLCAIGQVFILSISSLLASTWFGSEEVSTACAIAVLGTQVGNAIGAIWSTNAVRNSEDVEIIEGDFMLLHIINASITCSILILVLIFFRAKPRLPPSQSEVETTKNGSVSLKQSFTAMAKNKSYLLLLLVVGGSSGIISGFAILVNGIYTHYFPGSETELGFVSAGTILAGSIGSLAFGFVLDKWHKFKLTLFLSIFLSGITYVFVVLSFEQHQKVATYFTMPIFGFFSVSTMVVGFEFATEMMYPTPAATVCSVLNSVIFIFGLVYSVALETLFDVIGYLPAFAVVVACYMICSCAVYLLSGRLHRREANVAGR